jgi:protein-S-isoprenylcysteine O-methyltransferase Ste14
VLLPVLLGAASYVVFALHDMLELRYKKAPDGAWAKVAAQVFFVAGMVLLSSSISLATFRSGLPEGVSLVVTGFFALLGVVFFAAFVYSLFGALPAKKTYLEMKNLTVIDTGLYALCRHPGVILLALFYLFLCLALRSLGVLAVGASNTLANLAYTALQDIWIFPTTIEGYREYKKNTPFLIPTRKSLLRAAAALRKKTNTDQVYMDMRFEDKLKTWRSEDIWQEYCGFLDLSIEEYMNIQERLLMEQIDQMARCGLGQKLFNGRVPKTLQEFRRDVPLTTYDDYADVLLPKRVDMLPAEPVVWIQTTWEGGSRPSKIAPYSSDMIETYKKNAMAALILSTSDEKGRFNARGKKRMLYSLAPMPYATGLIPSIIESQLTWRFLPSLKESRRMSLQQKSQRGFELGLRHGMNYMVGMSSILQGMSRNFNISELKLSPSKIFSMSPPILLKYLVAKYLSIRDSRPIMPRDLFNLDGFIVAGTDSTLYKDELEMMWGRRPLELAGGTESTCLGVETWSKNGLVFFPDACFYEFIPENEMLRSIQHPGYEPHAYMLNELVANQNYELVITSLKGGAFVRYRIGDVYRCLRVKNKQDGLDMPQFEYVDRTPNMIDIAGFTRITEQEIETVIKLSCLPVTDWFALKQYDDNNHAYLHLYIEVEGSGDMAMTPHTIKDHMNVYFKFYDGDYKDLKQLLGVDPLRVTLLRTGTIQKYKDLYSVHIPKINPSRQEVIDMLHIAYDGVEVEVASC